MTIKEICELIGKNKSTIGRWVKNTGLQNAIDKLQNATGEKPAMFTLDEVIEIIRAGGEDLVERVIALEKENYEINYRHRKLQESSRERLRDLEETLREVESKLQKLILKDLF